MSRGHGNTTATISTPHGPASVTVIVGWVKCDSCEASITGVGDRHDDGEDICDRTIQDNGWMLDAGETCPECLERERWADEADDDLDDSWSEPSLS